MKSIRNMAFSALLAVGAFTMVTYTACTKDECEDVQCNNGGACVSGTCNCASFYEGTSCDTEVRTKYYNTYVGNGTDSDGGTYTGWKIKFAALGTDAKTLELTLTDDNNASFIAVTVTLQTNTTFTVNQKTDGSDVITGNGTVNAESANLTLVFTNSGLTTDVLTFNFNNMLKQ